MWDAEEERTGSNNGRPFCSYQGDYTWDFFENFLKEHIGETADEINTPEPEPKPYRGPKNGWSGGRDAARKPNSCAVRKTAKLNPRFTEKRR